MSTSVSLSAVSWLNPNNSPELEVSCREHVVPSIVSGGKAISTVFTTIMVGDDYVSLNMTAKQFQQFAECVARESLRLQIESVSENEKEEHEDRNNCAFCHGAGCAQCQYTGVA